MSEGKTLKRSRWNAPPGRKLFAPHRLCENALHGVELPRSRAKCKGRSAPALSAQAAKSHRQGDSDRRPLSPRLLEAGSPRPWCHQHQCPMRTLFWVCRPCLLTGSSGGREWVLVSLFFFYLFLYLRIHFLKIISFFNWRIISLQNFVIFCQTSTWISHRSTLCPLSLEPPSHHPPHPTPLGWYRAPVWVPWDKPPIPLAVYFTYNISFHLTLATHLTLSSLSPCPWVYFLCLFLRCCPASNSSVPFF